MSKIRATGTIPCQSCLANKRKLREYKKQDELYFNISSDLIGALPSWLVMINGIGLFFSDYTPLNAPLTSVVTNHLPRDDVNRAFWMSFLVKKIHQFGKMDVFMYLCRNYRVVTIPLFSQIYLYEQETINRSCRTLCSLHL